MAARVLLGAERIYITAAGDTYLTAMGFANMMMKINHTTVCPGQYLEHSQMISGATDKDAVIVVSYSGTILSSLKHDLLHMRQKRVPIIVASSKAECPEADYLLPIPDKESMIGNVAGYYSQAAIRYTLNCLYGLIYSLDMEKHRHYKDSADSFAYGGEGPK